ncbi:hypothetical protein QYM36_017593 [Artemia franciscana]|uniref:Endonuclease/exonuclease/phosphatase domain-containing protein n=1 Tax=Artemia franciscana TaxID=6661 RepID=A0AA88HB09_ARTSF|nr:hypothetical protein QYM36_017593 [Artemia franciscana]
MMLKRWLKSVSMTLLTQFPRIHDMIIFATDFNAKLSNDRDYCPEELSPHGLGDRNENGAVLMEVASTNNLLIGGTQLRHKNIHMCAWTSPDGKTRNQIDQFLIKRKWRSNLQALKTLRGADLAQTTVSVSLRLC